MLLADAAAIVVYTSVHVREMLFASDSSALSVTDVLIPTCTSS